MTSILLVDDHELLREGLGTMIDSRKPLKVVGQANDGLQAIDLATKLHPDITVMDIRLPHMSGIDATSEIVKRDPAAKVIILSVHEKRSIVESSFRAGAMAYVVKSAASSELFEAIDAVSDGKSYLSPAVTQTMLDSITTNKSEPRDGPAFASLTNREREVLQQIAEGLGNREIAEALQISPRTVESHRASLMKKLGVHKASTLVRIAIREELVTL
ncbi:MAG: response regulator transcription factor [Myxococcota bacterium]|nr:response regulator transcription factor [Myxococcota bacterium]